MNDPHVQERRRVEAFVEATFDRAYGSRISTHYPTLMSVQDECGRIYAVAGFRFARESTLFLEQYLDQPVETALEKVKGDVLPRTAIAEIGNLASDGRGASLFLFLSLASHLRDAGCEYAVATTTRELRGIFARTGFPIAELGRADPTRLPDGGQSWGAYYEADPVVVAGSIAETLSPLSRFAAGEPTPRGVRSRLHYSGSRSE